MKIELNNTIFAPVNLCTRRAALLVGVFLNAIAASAWAVIPIDVSKVSYSVVAQHHHDAKYFKKHIADDIVGAGEVTWEDSGPGLSSCAVRMSIALAWGGINWGKEWPNCANCWKLKGKDFLYPSKASDYKKLLKNPRKVSKPSDIPPNEKGVIAFLGGFEGASGHVTLWDGKKCRFDDCYWEATEILFWKLAE